MLGIFIMCFETNRSYRRILKHKRQHLTDLIYFFIDVFGTWVTFHCCSGTKAARWSRFTLVASITGARALDSCTWRLRKAGKDAGLQHPASQLQGPDQKRE